MPNYWTEEQINKHVDSIINISVVTQQHPYTVLSKILRTSHRVGIPHLKELKEKAHTGLKLKAHELPYIL